MVVDVSLDVFFNTRRSHAVLNTRHHPLHSLLSFAPLTSSPFHPSGLQPYPLTPSMQHHLHHLPRVLVPSASPKTNSRTLTASPRANTPSVLDSSTWLALMIGEWELVDRLQNEDERRMSISCRALFKGHGDDVEQALGSVGRSSSAS